MIECTLCDANSRVGWATNEPILCERVCSPIGCLNVQKYTRRKICATEENSAESREKKVLTRYAHFRAFAAERVHVCVCYFVFRGKSPCTFNR